MTSGSPYHEDMRGFIFRINGGLPGDATSDRWYAISTGPTIDAARAALRANKEIPNQVAIDDGPELSEAAIEFLGLGDGTVSWTKFS